MYPACLCNLCSSIDKTDISFSLLYYLALSTQHNPVSGTTGDSSDIAKNLGSELMAHVDQMAAGGQDGAAHQARNFDSNGPNTMTVSIHCFVMECIAA